MVVFGQSGCIRARLLFLGKVGSFGQGGWIWEKVVYSAKWLYSGKVVAFGKKWLYSGKVVVFGRSSCIRANWLHLGRGGCIRANFL